MIRRSILALLVAFAVFVAASPAWAGSYLNRAALLLDQARKEGDMLQPHSFDKELAGMVKALAEVRAKAARKMEIPAAIAKAHPHLLLVLENSERAAEAALAGNFKKFMEYLMAARDEDRTFRSLVRELGYVVPELGSRK